jgi:predicted permease
MGSDLRYAWRSLWKSPSTTIGALLALALGIGATTAMFALLNAVLLRPLSFPASERLVEIYGTVERLVVERRGASYPDYFDWRDRSTSFDGMASWSPSTFILYGAGEPVPSNGEIIDGPYFELLGVGPVAGRVFEVADHRPGAAAVAVIGERLWERRFGRQAAAVGRSIQLDRTVYTIVGVVPAAFQGRSDAAEVYVTAVSAISPNELAARGDRGFAVLARLGVGVSLAAAQAEMDNINLQLATAYPGSNDKRAAEVSPLSNEVFGPVRPAVSLLFGGVALVLLLACANVASLLLGRSEARRREFSLRRAMGADDRQLVRLLLCESAWLVVVGGGLGWLLALWAGDALIALSPMQLPSFAAPGIDWRVLLFVSALGLGTTVLIGLTPLGTLGRGESLAQHLREGALDSRGGTGTRTLKAIVIGEVAMTVALLTVAALLLRSFAGLLSFDPGFDPKGVLSLQVQLQLSASQDQPAGDQGLDALALVDDLKALPGVAAASLTSDVPLQGASAIFYSAEGQIEEDAQTRPRAYVHRVTPGHFDALGLRMLDGRDFATSELGIDSTAVIVSEGVAARFWPGQTAVGRRIKRGSLGADLPWLTIVGVVEDANLRGIPRNPTGDPDLYFPYNERARAFAVLLRTTGDPASLAGPARDVLRRRDAGTAVFGEQTLEALVGEELASARFLSWLLSAFAALALALSIIGIYGVLAYWVGRRAREFGVRAALGASSTRLVGLVIGQGLLLAVVGIVVGATAAVWLAGLAQSQLYGVGRFDPVSLAGTAAVMLLTAGLASLLPALRVLRADPMAVLRGN